MTIKALVKRAFCYSQNHGKFSHSEAFIAFRYKDMAIQIKACILYGNM